MTDTGMFGWITQDDIDNPFTQPGTATPVVEPTSPWWLGPNPNTGQQPWEFAGSPGQAAWTAAQPLAQKAAAKSFDPGVIKNLLRQFQLEELLPLLGQWEVDDLSPAQIEALLYDRTSEAGKVVDRLYPELRLRQDAKRAPMSIIAIRAYRDQRRAMFRQFGTPEGFYDEDSDATEDIVNDRSLGEIKDVLTEWSQVRDEALANPDNIDTLDELNRLHNLDLRDPGALLAYMIDKDRALPAIRRQVDSSRLSATAARTGFGGLTREEAEELAAAGEDPSQAAGAFSTLATSAELFDALPGEQGAAVSRKEQLDAAFRKDASALGKVDLQRGKRKGVFEGGGGIAASRTGLGLTAP